MNVNLKYVVVAVAVLLTLGIGARAMLARWAQERSVREAAAQRANLEAFEADHARREEAAAARRLRDREETAATDELRRQNDRKIRASGQEREEQAVQAAVADSTAKRAKEAERARRLRDLEAQRAASPWAKVKKGMSGDEVLRLLGKPTEGGAAVGTWTYIDHATLGRGTVSFADGKVESVHDPFISQAWSDWGQVWPGLDADSRASGRGEATR